MRIVFMGSADIACPGLETAAAEPRDRLVAAVTKPDRPQGRRLQVSPCPAKAVAVGLGVPVLTPASVNAPDTISELAALAPDLIVVVAYGEILGERLVALPPRGCINVHFSLLPRYRGAAPVQWAIANGDAQTGVTTMYLNARVDAGDIIFQASIGIAPDDTGGSLSQKLALEGARLLARTLNAIRDGSAPRQEQSALGASRAPKLKKSDGTMDWTRAAIDLHNRVRAFEPWPGSYCEAPRGSGNRLRVTRSRVDPGKGGVPGEIIGISDEGPLVATGQDALRLLGVQPAGKRCMPGGAFMRGHRMGRGERLG